MPISMELSILIITHNSEGYIKNCLNSIFASKSNPDMEVIIVDNFSSDKTLDTIQSTDSPVKIIRNRENIGFAKANNQAMKIAKGKYIFLLNPDTEIDSDALEIFYNYLEDKDNANVWCVGGQLVDENGNPSKSYGRFPNLLDVLIEQFGIKGIALKIFGQKWISRNRWIGNEIIVPFIMGCNMFIRRETLDKIGHFNESFFLNYEEVELSWRAKQKGSKSVVLPQVVIKHYSGKSFTNLKEYLNHLWLGQVYFFKFTRGKVYFKLVKLIHLIGSLLRHMLKMDKNYLSQFRNIKAI
ncbi:MAG: glycosyltransferase family 2 protein [Melioribacteraceae bacterium]|nr:MAG: glycosyltransferase family 2 protein [Melioribacteraceae bacterium]